MAKEKEGNAPGSEEMVSVPKSFVEDTKKQIADLTNLVAAVADKSRLDKFNARQASPLTHFVMVSTYEDDKTKGKQIVVAWRSIQDEVFKANGIWHEVQYCEITLEDDSKRKLAYPDFVRLLGKSKAEVLSRTTDSQGHEILKLACEDGRERLIDSTFVN